jgi:hypothetical protein
VEGSHRQLESPQSFCERFFELAAAVVTFWVMLRIILATWLVLDPDGPSASPLLTFSVCLLPALLVGKVVFHLLARSRRCS